MCALCASLFNSFSCNPVPLSLLDGVQRMSACLCGPCEIIEMQTILVFEVLCVLVQAAVAHADMYVATHATYIPCIHWSH